jgi:hypothetical protein
MLSGPTSYLFTLDEYLAHWQSVNADPAAGTGLLTRDEDTRAGLLALRGALDTAADVVQEKLAGKEIGRAVLENAKRATLNRAQELGRRMRGVLPKNSPFLKASPDLPAQTAAMETFLQPLRTMVNLWARLELAGINFELNGVTQLVFKNEVKAIGTYFSLQAEAELDLKLARETRNQLQEEARAILSAYRPAVEGLFALDSPLVLTIPLLYPTSGHTPEPVTAAASYDAAAHEAVITFTESTEENLESYQVRGVPGPDYDGDDEVVVATIPKGAARELRTDYSLSGSGMQASFKVYVVLTTGNEAGSNVVTVERP